jgi:hypothetical protein
MPAIHALPWRRKKIGAPHSSVHNMGSTRQLRAEELITRLNLRLIV